MNIRHATLSRRSWVPALMGAGLLALFPAACTNGDDDDSGGDAGPTRCIDSLQCPETWVCYLNVCVEHYPDAGLPDAAQPAADAGPPGDAGSDAGPRDASSPDAHVSDAGPPPADAGQDAGTSDGGPCALDGGCGADAAADAGSPQDASVRDAAVAADAAPVLLCTGYQLWDADAGVCVEPPLCTADEDCLSPRVCLEGTCQAAPECRSDAECNGGRCDRITYTCHPAACVTNDQCPANGAGSGACVNYECYRCRLTTTGDGGELIYNDCNAAAECPCQGDGCQPAPDRCYRLECLVDENCPSGTVCDENICYQCRTSADGGVGPSPQCAGNLICSDHRCAEQPTLGCTSNSDCTGLRECVSGHCQEPNCTALAADPTSPFYDGFEPDNSSSQAQVLGEGQFNGTICTGDYDWYRLNLQLGEGLLARAQVVDPKYGLLEMHLFGADGFTMLRGSTHDATGDTIGYEYATQTPVFIRLHGLNSPMTPYVLTIDIAPGGFCAPDAQEPNDLADYATVVAPTTEAYGTAERLSLCPYDEDWYRADVGGQGIVGLNLTMRTNSGPTPVVELYFNDASNMVLRDTSTDAIRYLNYTGTGTYWVRVYNTNPMAITSGLLLFQAQAQ